MTLRDTIVSAIQNSIADDQASGKIADAILKACREAIEADNKIPWKYVSQMQQILGGGK